MIEVKVRDNSDIAFDKAVKMFQKIVNNAGFLREIQERRYFQKPSEKKRAKLRKRRNE